MGNWVSKLCNFLKENYMYESHKHVPCFLFLERKGNTVYIDGDDEMINFFAQGREAQIQLRISSDFNLDLRNKEEINRFMNLGGKLVIKENKGKKELWYESNWNFVKMDEDEMSWFWVFMYDGCRKTRENYIWQDWW